MITDFVSMMMIQNWLGEHAPQYASSWRESVPANPPSQARQAILELEASAPHMGATFLSQTCIAKHAITAYQLHDVAILGAGRPHPFSPAPDKVMYYADQLDDVLESADAQGYRAVQLDVSNTKELTKLKGARSAIATGLLHFFSDDVLADLFRALAGVGIRRFVFNHLDLAVEQHHLRTSLAYLPLYPRGEDEIRRLLGGFWRIDDLLPQGDFIRSFPGLGSQLADQPHRANVFAMTATGVR